MKDYIQDQIKINGVLQQPPLVLSQALDIAFEDDGDNDPLRQLYPSQINELRRRVIRSIHHLVRVPIETSNSGDGYKL